MNQNFVPPQASAAARPRMVHEAETQRQHVRLRVPIQVEIGGQPYQVPDWSVGGVGIQDLSPTRPVGAICEGQLVFKLQGFDFKIPVKMEVRHVTARITGCRFVDVTSSQTELLQYLVGAYVSGELVTSGDLMVINRRQNFVSPRKAPSVKVSRWSDLAGRYLGSAVLALLGLALISYVVVAVYQRLYVSTLDGFVGTPTTSYVRAPGDGVIERLDLNLQDRVSSNMVVGTLTDPLGRAQNLVATCDCVVVATPTPVGSVVQRGSPVAVLAAPDTPVLFVVRVPGRQVSGLKVGERAAITFYNGAEATGGTVVSLERYTPIDYTSEHSGPSLQSYLILLIKPDRQLALSDYGEPVRVQIDRMQLFASAPRGAAGQ